MKLTEEQIALVEARTGRKPVAEDSAAQKEFAAQFGEHSFYPDEHGLFIFEPGAGDAADDAADRADTAHGVQIATWIREGGDIVRVGVTEPTPIGLAVSLKPE